MKTFPSIAELINYYNEKLTIPSRIAVTINGSVHEFKRTSTHNKDKISKGMVDNYSFVEDENCGLGIELHVNYYRYFEAKQIVEAYLLFFHDEKVPYLHPIYFHKSFVSDDEFAPYKNQTSTSLEKWTGLKWINLNNSPDAFADIRAGAYRNIKKDLISLVPPLIDPELEADQQILDHLTAKYKKKWLINEHGQSAYFKKPFEVPEYW